MTRRPWSYDDDNRLRELAEAGVGYDRIGKILGRTQQAVQNRAYSLQIRFKRKGKAKPELDRLAGITLNNETLIFAETGPSCARCGVREDVHPIHGCGRFASDLRVRT
jgi:hypothetical protein